MTIKIVIFFAVPVLFVFDIAGLSGLGSWASLVIGIGLPSVITVVQ